jgi:hypothetical protein
MRTIGFLLTACAVLSVQASVAFASGIAPADEYFGRHKMSILEIRNRLSAVDSRRDSELRGDRGVVRRLDDLEDAMVDWQHKYPRDPWLPSFLARLLRDYHRASAGADARAQVALRVLRYDYARAPETHSIVAMYSPPHSSSKVRSSKAKGTKVVAVCHRSLFHHKC